MKNRHQKTSTTFLFLILLISAISKTQAQVPIEDLRSKYKHLENLKVFNLSQEELKVSKKVSLNLDEKQKKLINETDEQCTLLYTGRNPSAKSLFDETINILNAKRYLISKDSKIGETREVRYIMVNNGTIKEIVTIIMNNNTLSILVSKGNFDPKEYKQLKKSNSQY